jgi:hypothetical protein
MASDPEMPGVDNERDRPAAEGGAKRRLKELAMSKAAVHAGRLPEFIR